MDHVVVLFALVGLWMNLNQVLMPEVPEDNDFTRLVAVYEEQALPIEGIVLEGWLPVRNEKAVRSFLQEWVGLGRSSDVQEQTWADGSTQRVYLCQREQTVVEFQLITSDLALAQQQYALWQKFSKRYAGGQPVGITLMSELKEPLEERACQLLARDLAQDLDGKINDVYQADRYRSYVLNSPQLQQKLKINGANINCNLAFVQQQDQTAVYLGSPVIYQQY